MFLTRTSEPATEPVTLAEIKAHLGVTISDDDARLTSLLSAARRQAETYTRQSFVTQTWQASFDAFPVGGVLSLSQGPLASVTSVGYVDAAGEAQTFTDFTLDAAANRILLDYDEEWPDTLDTENAVTITYIAGYGAAAAVPEDIKAAICLMVEQLYDRPDVGYAAALQGAISSLLNPHRDMRQL